MYVLEAGEGVILLQFLPDGRRLLVGVSSSEGAVHLDLWALRGGERVRLRLPPLRLQDWQLSGHGHAVAVHPAGERCYVAWGGRLFAFRTADGAPLPGTDGVRANQVVLSPGGDRMVTAAGLSGEEKHLTALAAGDAGVKVVWEKTMPRHFRHVSGFLPGGDRFVTVDDKVRVRSFPADEEQSAARYPTYNAHQPQLSADGRRLGVIGYSCMYVFDTAALGKPRRIGGTANNGNFVSFAFHPGGRTLAVVHGGPTLVKVYDVGTLKRVRTYRWNLGPLRAVAFSPDGMLGAAGSRDGRVAVWDVDG